MPYKDPEKQRAYLQEHYRRNRDDYVSRRRSSRVDRALFIREQKARPCADCGDTYPYYVMQFDHRPDEDKIAQVSKMSRNFSMVAIRNEIAKCDVVCSNCHATRTYLRACNSVG